MIESIGRVMLYVKDPEAAAAFWVNKVGFVELGRLPGPDGVGAVEVAPAARADTSFVLYARDLVAQLAPERSLAPPSILFSTHALDETRVGLLAKGVGAGEITVRDGMRTFRFSDDEGNFFAVREVD